MTRAEAYQPSPKLPADELGLFTKYVQAVAYYGAARNIPFSRQEDLKRPVTSPRQTAPLCACGCDERVTGRRGTWNWYAKGHQPRPGMGEASKAKARRRMQKNNPMKRPEVAAKVGAKMRGWNRHTPDGLAKISAAARHRMLTKNPMHDPQSFARSMKNRITPQERMFKRWIEWSELPIDFAGDGGQFLGIGLCPDFVVHGQKKAIEIGTAKSRSIRYCETRMKAIAKAGWQGLIILDDDPLPYQNTIMWLMEGFVKGNFSGAWKNGKWMQFDASTGTFPFTTFRAIRVRATSPTA